MAEATYNGTADRAIVEHNEEEFVWAPGETLAVPEGLRERLEPDARFDVGDDSEKSFSGWTVPELRDELEDRGLPSDGLKNDLVERLEEDENSF